MFETVASRKELRGSLIWIASWIVATTVGLLMTPSASGHATHTQLGLPPCPSVLLFSKPCPGCGMTTSVSALLHGDFHLAWSSHPFGFLLYAIWTLTALAMMYGWIAKKQLVTNRRSANIAMILFAIAFGTYGIVRFFNVKY